MRVSQALELAEQSMDSFKASLEELKIKELVELTDNLRFIDSPEVFKTAHDLLIDKLENLWGQAKENEPNLPEIGVSILRRYIDEETGLTIYSDTQPTVGLRKYIDEIISWKK